MLGQNVHSRKNNAFNQFCRLGEIQMREGAPFCIFPSIGRYFCFPFGYNPCTLLYSSFIYLSIYLSIYLYIYSFWAKASAACISQLPLFRVDVVALQSFGPPQQHQLTRDCCLISGASQMSCIILPCMGLLGALWPCGCGCCFFYLLISFEYTFQLHGLHHLISQVLF